jgi:hypothetical protein
MLLQLLAFARRGLVPRWAIGVPDSAFARRRPVATRYLESSIVHEVFSHAHSLLTGNALALLGSSQGD